MENLEKEVLCSCMWDYENMLGAIEAGVTPAWFKESRHGELFRFIAKLSRSEMWNKRSCVTVMQAGKVFEKFPEALDYFQSPPSWAHSAEDFASAVDVLRSNHATRTVMVAANRAITALDRGDDPFDVLESLSVTTANIEEIDSDATKSVKEVAGSSFKIDEMIANGKPLGLPFPWASFQNRTFGLPSKTVVPLAGRDGKGKSRLAICLTHHWLTRGDPILYFPFEDTSERMVSSLAATHGGYDMFTIRRNFVPHGFMEKHAECLEEVSKFPLYISDFSTSVERIVTTIARHKRKYGITGVVIDGFKDIIPTNGENQTQRENSMMAALVRAAKEYDVTIMPVFHLTKIENDRWISKQSIKGSGNQTTSARMVLVYQDSGFPSGMNEMYGDMEGKIVLECQKANYGDTGCVILEPELQRGRFNEIHKGASETEEELEALR